MRSERVLVWLKPQYLGDAVMATPLLDALSAEFDRPYVSAGPGVRALLQDREDRLRLVPAAASRRLRDFWRHVRGVRAANYDTVVLVNRSFRSALISRLAGIRVRVGHMAEGRNLLLTKPVPYDEKRAEAECFLDLGRAIGVDTPDAWVHLSVSDKERAAGAFRDAGDWVGVQPGARSPWKQIPMETLASVAQGLRNQGFKIALFGGAGEEEDAATFEHAIGGEALNLVGKCELRQTMGALTHLKMLVGSDTGLMHVAAALGCPTLTVFGIVPASKWGHNYAPHVAIQAPGNDLSQVDPKAMLEAARSVLGRSEEARRRVPQGDPMG